MLTLLHESAGSNVVATFCQYEALKYVSFPVQTLGKTAKMIPVMIWGALVNQKSYKGKDYFIATMITGGCALFALTGAQSCLTATSHVGHALDIMSAHWLLLQYYMFHQLGFVRFCSFEISLNRTVCGLLP